MEAMATTPTEEQFTGTESGFERKYDGIRLLAFGQGPDVRLLSRNRLPQKLPPIGEALANLPVHDVILDGEGTWGKAVCAVSCIRHHALLEQSSPLAVTASRGAHGSGTQDQGVVAWNLSFSLTTPLQRQVGGHKT
jgi:ATP-dependent DNA ligase